MYIENLAENLGWNLNWWLGKVRQNCQLLAFIHEALARPQPIKKPPLFPSIQNTNTTSIHTSSGLNNNVFFGDKDITRGTLSIPTYTELVLNDDIISNI